MTLLNDVQPTTTPSPVAVEGQAAPATSIAMEATLPAPGLPTPPITTPNIDVNLLVDLVMAEMARKAKLPIQVTNYGTTQPVATALADSVPSPVDTQPTQPIATPATQPADAQVTAEPPSHYARMQLQLTMLQNALIHQGKQMACGSLGIEPNSDLATALVNPTLGQNGEILFNGLPMDKFVAVIQTTFNRNQPPPTKSRITIHPNQGGGGWPDSRIELHELLSAL